MVGKTTAAARRRVVLGGWMIGGSYPTMMSTGALQGLASLSQRLLTLK
jgi:hypothetical protein